MKKKTRTITVNGINYNWFVKPTENEYGDGNKILIVFGQKSNDGFQIPLHADTVKPKDVELEIKKHYNL